MNQVCRDVEGRTMLKPCLICFKLTEKWDSDSSLQTPAQFIGPKEERPTNLHLFLKLLERYLETCTTRDDDKKGDGEAMRFLLEKVITAGVTTCDDCSKIVKSFCKYYHQMKSIEVILNWKLGIFKEILRTAHNHGNIEFLADLRKKLINKCTRKLQNTFPKILLRRSNHSQKRLVANTSFEISVTSEMYHTTKSQTTSQRESEEFDSCMFCDCDQDNEAKATRHLTTGLKRFLKLLERHLDEINLHGGDDKLENIVSFGKFICENCVKVMDSFCKLYHKIKSFEVLLNCELRILWDTMSTAQQLPSRIIKFKKAARLLSEIEDFSPNEIIILILEYKLDLIEKCAKKLRMSFPRVSLEVYQPKSHQLTFCEAIPPALVTEKSVVKTHPPQDRRTKWKPVRKSSKSKEARRTQKNFKLKPISKDSSSSAQRPKRAKRKVTIASIETPAQKYNEDVEVANSIKSENSDIDLIPNTNKLKFISGQPLQLKEIAPDKPTQSDDTTLATTIDVTSTVSDALTPISTEQARAPNSKFNPKTGKHECIKCSKEFTYKSRCTLHYNSFHLRLTAKCPFCGMLISQRSVNRHFKKFHPEAVTYKCHVCSEIFKTEDGLTKHQNTSKHKNPPKPQPRQDGKTKRRRKGEATRKEVWKNRSSVDSKTGFHTCSLCPKEYSTHAKFKEHYRRQHQKTTFSCDNCPKIFSLKKRLEYHQRKRTCQAKDSTAAPPRIINPETGKFKCSLCKNEYNTHRSLRCHYQAIHLGARLKCNNCGDLFMDNSGLRKHERLSCRAIERSSAVINKHMCHLCGRGFKKAYDLKRHMNDIHVKLQDNICSHCGRRFSQLSSLKRHVDTVHLEERKHLCDLCGSGFKWKTSLDSHRRNVHGETYTTDSTRNPIQLATGTNSSSEKNNDARITTAQEFPTETDEPLDALSNDDRTDISIPISRADLCDEDSERTSNTNQEIIVPPSEKKQNRTEDEESIRSASSLHCMEEEVGSPPEVPNENCPYQNSRDSSNVNSSILSSSKDSDATFTKINSNNNWTPLEAKTAPTALGNSVVNADTAVTASDHMSVKTQALSKIGMETPEKVLQTTSSRLRSRHRCLQCPKTFTSKSKLEEHYQSHDYKPTEDGLECDDDDDTKMDRVGDGILEDCKSEPDESYFDYDNEEYIGEGEKLAKGDVLLGKNTEAYAPQQRSAESDSDVEDTLQKSNDIPKKNENQKSDSNSKQKTRLILQVEKSNFGTDMPNIAMPADTEIQDVDEKFEPCNSPIDKDDTSETELLGNPKEESTVITSPENSRKGDDINPMSIYNPKTGKHKCTICSKEFFRNCNMNEHYTRYHGKVRYACPTCESEFLCERDYKIHWRHVHSGTIHKCIGCDKIFGDKAHLTKHYRIAKCTALIPEEMAALGLGVVKRTKPLIPVPPSIIQHYSDEKKSIKEGQRQSRRNAQNPRIIFNPETGKYKCTLCSKELSNRNDVRAHYIRHHGKVKHACPKCGKAFRSENDYHQHWRRMHSGVTYKCHPCEKTYADKGSLRKHYQVTKCTVPVPKEIEPINPTEPLIPTPPSIIQNYENDKRKQGPVVINCASVGHSLSNQVTLKSLKSQSSLNPQTGRYKCSHCDKEYKTSVNCQHHYREIHLGVRYKCDKCSELFIQKSYLRIHQRFSCRAIKRSITVKHRHICHLCGKKFTKPCILNRHILAIHSKLQDYVCCHCGRRFSEAGSLKRHINAVHLGQREHLCDLCGKGFSYNFSLNGHRRKVHGAGPSQPGSRSRQVNPTVEPGTSAITMMSNSNPIDGS